MAESRLKAFQVGEHDLVAHYSAEDARELLLKDGNYDKGDILPSDVHECSEEFLGKPTRDEDGNQMSPWRKDLEKGFRNTRSLRCRAIQRNCERGSWSV